MFDDSRYNLIRYSVNLNAKTFAIAESFLESMNSVAGGVITVDVRGKYADAVHSYALGTISVVSDMAASEILISKAKMLADVTVKATATETLTAAAEGRKNPSAAVTFAERLEATAQAAKYVPTALTASGALRAAAAASKNIRAYMMAADVLTAVLKATSQTTETAVIQISIPPGGELRLDSNIFTVTLNGENVLHTQLGDWINVSRELLRLIVESATGGVLEGQLIYTERFL